MMVEIPYLDLTTGIVGSKWTFRYENSVLNFVFFLLVEPFSDMGGFVSKQAFLPPPATRIQDQGSVLRLPTKDKHLIPVIHVKQPEYDLVFI